MKFAMVDISILAERTSLLRERLEHGPNPHAWPRERRFNTTLQEGWNQVLANPQAPFNLLEEIFRLRERQARLK
jgi:hypothetical protein